MYYVSSLATKPLTAEVMLNGSSTRMEVDTGVSALLISEESFKVIEEGGTVYGQAVYIYRRTHGGTSYVSQMSRWSTMDRQRSYH